MVPETRPVLPESESFFSVSDPNIHITAVKKAEDKNAIVVRMFNETAPPGDVSLHSYFRLHSVQQTNILEMDGKPIPSTGNAARIYMGKYSIETVEADVK